MPFPSSQRMRYAAASFVVAAAAVLVYREALGAYFFDDDFQWLVGTWSFRAWNLVDFRQLTHFYRPVIDLYFAAATPLFDGSPTLFHAASIVLHVVNGWLLFAFAGAIAGRLAFGFLAALLFVVQPSDVDAIAWVGALAEPVGACFGCVALLAVLRFRRTGRRVWYGVSIAAFVVALLTHESSVVFLPLMLLTDLAFTGRAAEGGTQRSLNVARRYAPHALLMACYLVVNVIVNSRNYVVTEGYYGVGPHVVTNALEYVTALYVGRRDAVNYVFVLLVVPLLLLRGSVRVRFAAAWLLLAMLPFLFFTWGTASRYLYLPAMGFAMLLADGVLWMGRVLAPRTGPRVAAAAVALVAAAVTVRFVLFATANVASFTKRTDAYRQYAAQFRAIHGDLPRHSRVQPDARLSIPHEHRFVRALIQWEYKDPTIELVRE